MPGPVAAPSRGWRVLAFAATLLSGALLALVAAHWTWQLFGPPRVDIPVAAPPDPVSALLASGLWASGGAPAAATPAQEAPQVLGGDARLLGVFAEPGGRGYALFRLPSGPRLVAAGEEIASGATLAAVRPDGISVRETAGERVIALRSPAPPPKPATLPKAEAMKGPGTAARSACAPPPGFQGQVVALNAELMAGLIAQPESWRALVEPAGGALVVRDESGFATMLGLRRGDRIEQANGIALNAPDDIVGAVLRPLQTNEPVRVVGTRDGRPRELWLRNAGC
jgi:hypothetical protein